MLDIHFIDEMVNEIISEHTADTLREALKDDELSSDARRIIVIALHHIEGKES